MLSTYYLHDCSINLQPILISNFSYKTITLRYPATVVARNIKDSSFDRWMFVVQTYWTKTVRELNRNANDKRGKGSIEKPNTV